MDQQCHIIYQSIGLRGFSSFLVSTVYLPEGNVLTSLQNGFVGQADQRARSKEEGVQRAHRGSGQLGQVDAAQPLQAGGPAPDRDRSDGRVQRREISKYVVIGIELVT